jgi:hypothetical protein
VKELRARLIGKGLRAALLCINWAAASFCAYLGVMLYAFSFGPERRAHSVTDRLSSVSFFALVLLLNFVMARVPGFASRSQGSLGCTCILVIVAEIELLVR